MFELLLTPEIQCFPLWVERDGVKDNTDPGTLPLSAGLVADLDGWRARWDAAYDLDDPLDAGFSSPEEERAFEAEGERLAAGLREELGSGWTVSLRVPA
ncbi:hypothetical protein [Streptomyces sp. 8L]|uniref:hypothetical protein n=1 Tax=Streptomyces sp. 8L TaxID=2877242 RepID=UPI001CD2254D|nr:hypothetical protein [Streptomyces sp. 8L]MCA1222840.1 hypothetical protein [Streptomyces sp. 8L]